MDPNCLVRAASRPCDCAATITVASLAPARGGPRDSPVPTHATEGELLAPSFIALSLPSALFTLNSSVRPE